MKKLLYIVGFGTLAYGGYRYFKHQVNLALSYNYNIADIKILELNDQRADIRVDVKLENKSSFEVQVTEYDIDLFYGTTKIAHTDSGEPFKIYPESSVTVTAIGSIVFGDAFKALGPFITNVMQRKPINIQVSGHVKIKFLGIPHTIAFEKQSFNYSMDLLKDMGLSEKYEALKEKFPILRKI